MQFRKLGNVGIEVSALGFGAMRLPTIGGDRTAINEPEASRMIRCAIDNGLNYVDTAYPYHGGNSEVFLGKALQDGYRERIILATKLPSWLIEDAGDFDKYLTEQLHRLQTDHIDVYLLHALVQESWRKLEHLKVLDWLEKVRSKGLIRYTGFSTHASLKVFKDIVDSSDKWDVAQIQYNYLDEEIQAGTEGLHYAADRGLGVVIMEPLRGGVLANLPPAMVAEFRKQGKSPVELALRWLWDHPEVSVVLSGMSTVEQVVQNVSIATNTANQPLSASERDLVEASRDLLRRLWEVHCTACRYCQPCPNGVMISHMFQFYNSAKVHGALEEARQKYMSFAESSRASSCVQCRECESKCPQGILISEVMPKVDELLGEASC